MDHTTDQKQIRLTPGGKLYVIDAILILTNADLPRKIWNDFKLKKPEVIQYVEYHHSNGKKREPVTDSTGWSKIQTLLFDYLIDIETQ